MSKTSVLVIGGTGKTGRRVVAQLKARGVPVRAASRSGEQRFDWLDESTWGPALEGVGGIYITPLDGTSTTPALVKRAVESGVTKLVLLSARGMDTPGYYGDATDLESQLENERAVRDSGVEWTVLRPGWFAQNFDEGFFKEYITAGELVLPAGDGATSFVDAEDIAAVAVAALTEDGHAGETYELSGPRALTMGAALAEIGEAIGRELRYVAIPGDEFIATLTSQGTSTDEATMWTAALSPIERGLEAKISDGVRRALGRDARDFSEFVKDAAAAGAWRS